MSKKVFKRWTDEEIELLKLNSTKSRDELQRLFPDRSIKSVIHKITNMSLPRTKEYTRFSKSEDEILIENNMLPKENILEMLPGRDWESIRHRMKHLNLDRQKKWEYWTEKEIYLLKTSTSLEDAINKLPRRSVSKIKSMAGKLRLSLERTQWTQEEINLLINEYDKRDAIDIAKMLNRSIISIYQKANKLNLPSYRNTHVEITTNIVKLIINEELKLEDIQEEYSHLYELIIKDLTILKMYEEGRSSTQIADEFNTIARSITTILSRYNIEMRHMSFYLSSGIKDYKNQSKFLRRLRCTSDYRKWRKSVLDRDNYICQCCHVTEDLEVHHIHNFSSNEELRFVRDNGVTLCKNCHIGFHTTYGYRNNDDEQLNEFLSENLQVVSYS